METGSSSGSTRHRGKQVERQRRSFTDEEEETLLSLLKELVANGWKTDNGFRLGYLNKLHADMSKAIPGCTLRGLPQINSNITTWKRIYGSLSTMMNDGTGVGFNHTAHKITATDTQWAKVVKVNPSAHNM